MATSSLRVYFYKSQNHGRDCDRMYALRISSRTVTIRAGDIRTASVLGDPLLHERRTYGEMFLFGVHMPERGFNPSGVKRILQRIIGRALNQTPFDALPAIGETNQPCPSRTYEGSF